MDLSSPAFSYVFLVIPLLFSLVVFFQGLTKLSNKEPDGPVAVGFGVLLLVLVILAWFFFIR